MYVHFYLRQGVVYVPTVGKMGQGFYRDIEPVAAISVTDKEALRRIIAAKLTEGNPDVPTLPRRDWPAPVVLKPARVKSWAAFERGLSTWAIEDRDNRFSIIGSKKRPDGTRVDDPDQTIRFSSSVTLEQITDRMVKILQDTERR
jgi:hypothetical protein